MPRRLAVGLAALSLSLLGAAGPAHVAQFVNGGFAVFDKTGTLRTPPLPDTQFWISAGTPEALVVPGVSPMNV